MTNGEPLREGCCAAPFHLLTLQGHRGDDTAPTVLQRIVTRRPSSLACQTEEELHDRTDRRSTLLDSYENAAVIVSGIVADELGHRTPCPKYDVAGLIDHLVEAGHRAAALGRGQAPPPGDESPHVELSDAPRQLRSAAQLAGHAMGRQFKLVVEVHHAVGRGVHGGHSD